MTDYKEVAETLESQVVRLQIDNKTLTEEVERLFKINAKRKKKLELATKITKLIVQLHMVDNEDLWN